MYYCADGANGWSARITYDVKRRWTGMLRTNVMQYHPKVAAIPRKVLLFQVYGRKIVELTWAAQIITATLIKTKRYKSPPTLKDFNQKSL